MSLLVLIIVVLVVLWLAIYLVDQIPATNPSLAWMVKVLLILVAIVIILSRSGLLAGLN